MPDPSAWAQGGIIAGQGQAPKGQASPVFVAFDADANGALGGQELAALEQAMRAVLAGPQPVSSVLAAQFDTNRSGSLEVIEVDQARQRLLGTNNNGSIDAKERDGWQARTIIGLLEKQMDRNRDGLIDSKEFEVWESRTVIGSSRLTAPAPAAR